MKLLACSKCHDIVPLVQKEIRSCKCGNIKGKYIDKRNIEVSIKDKNQKKKSARIIMLPNSVRYGFKQENMCRVIPLDHESLVIKEENK